MAWSRFAKYLCVLLICFTASYFGCAPSEIEPSVAKQNNNSVESNQAGNNGGRLTQPAIIVGSFNIQNFDRTKASKPEAMNILVAIARRFDILAIQELRDIDQRVIPDFLTMINRNGDNYQAL